MGAALATKEVVLLADEDIQRFDVRVRMPNGSSLERTMSVLQQVERQARALPTAEVTGIVAQAGWSRTRLWPERGKQLGMVEVFLVRTERRGRRGKEIMEDLRQRLGDIAGSVSVEVAAVTFGPPAGMPIAIRVAGQDYNKMRRLADLIKADLRYIPNTVSISDDFRPGKRELRVRVDPERAALHGLTDDQVGLFVRAVYDGVVTSRYRLAAKLVPDFVHSAINRHDEVDEG